ncbi:dimethylmenaquinone methyltransferase [Burkholderia sp. Leaf177]|uniref:RraA family protein n=1 Tax=Burkholderia sp. Leaf177 TaxID=1736287 RepID=UPI000700DE97|nr:dimethylmenaquinone methyltransferase [Burkholderia sp. Leaf177]KQR81782.1 dimethylmenaquinone methyltransferase [Burkholderia sp. Leaf177]
MAYHQIDIDFPRLDASVLDQWRQIPAAVASDCMNRTQVMTSKIKPIFSGARLCGQARTVATMVGDCGPICNLIGSARLGEIIVVDAGGAEDIAVWGGVMAEEAVQRGIGGAVIDGAIRDVADMRRLNFPMFCRSVVPRGPHHGFGGTVDATIAVAGAPVSPGDIVLGDDDGVVIVPLASADDILKAAQAHLLKEAKWIEDIRGGVSISEMFSLPQAQTIDPS